MEADSHRVLCHNESKLKKKKKDAPTSSSMSDGGGSGNGGRDEHDDRVFNDVDQFIAILVSLKHDDDDDPHGQPPPQLPSSSIDRMLSIVTDDLSRYESSRSSSGDHHNSSSRWPVEFLDDVDHVVRLSAALSAFESSDANYKTAASKVSSISQLAASFLEDELKLLLEESNSSTTTGSGSTHRAQSSRHIGKLSLRLRDPLSDSFGSSSPVAAKASDDADDHHIMGPPYPPETVDKLRRIANLMMAAGRLSECLQAFSLARHSALDACLASLGFHRMLNTDDFHKMQWKQLQTEISAWIKALRRSISVLFPRERDLLDSVFEDEHRGVAVSLFNNLVRGVVTQLLNFTEAVTSTNGSSERLSKYLEMHEALRDALPELVALIPVEEEVEELKTEISTARSRIGDAAAASLIDFDNTIKSDIAKIPVQGGGIHPLTRNVMNYLKNASEHREALEQIFDAKSKSSSSSSSSPSLVSSSSTLTDMHTPLAAQIIQVMEQLDLNLEAKSKLYKELALRNIFLMNNGRYINKKIKECKEIYEVVGEKWYRKRSGELRQYHKNYQREGWSKILGCFRDEGMHVKEKISRTVLKERIKSFNAMFDEILKTQSSWVMCDEQLKSELKVSISAVLVPAYRSFLVKYRQNVTGRTSEKHIKYAAEDIESKIDELFEGSPSSHGRKK